MPVPLLPIYHRDYSQHEPVEITVEPDGIDILNCPGPDRSISMESIVKGDMLKSRRYRNRYLGDFLKELDLTEGRSTGVPTIQEKLSDNGSPRATFETTEDRLTFLIHIPIHPGCENNPLSVGTVKKTISSEIILDLIKNRPTISAVEIAMEIDMSARGVEKQIRKLRETGVIKRIGADFGGYWEIIER